MTYPKSTASEELILDEYLGVCVIVPTGNVLNQLLNIRDT